MGEGMVKIEEGAYTGIIKHLKDEERVYIFEALALWKVWCKALGVEYKRWDRNTPFPQGAYILFSWGQGEVLVRNEVLCAKCYAWCTKGVFICLSTGLG